MQYTLTTPCTAQDLAPLRAGDTVLLSGVVYTARDQAHKRMIEALDRGEPLPFDLEGSAIYYVGPTPERPGEVIGSAGPTTSGRMDAMSPRLLDLGNKIMIGKGKRDAAVKEAVVRNGAVYLAALGGAGALMAKSVQTLEVIAWPDLGCEAVRRLTVEQMSSWMPTAGICIWKARRPTGTAEEQQPRLLPNAVHTKRSCTPAGVQLLLHCILSDQLRFASRASIFLMGSMMLETDISWFSATTK